MNTEEIEKAVEILRNHVAVSSICDECEADEIFTKILDGLIGGGKCCAEPDDVDQLTLFDWPLDDTAPPICGCAGSTQLVGSEDDLA